MKLLILLILSFQLYAKSYQQKLEEWTSLNETKLLDKYSLVPSEWFSKDCIELAKQLNFDKIIQCELLDSKEINAYVLDNGHVYFSKAMMELLKNKNQWASILAHENAHLELNHYIKRLKKFEKPSVFFTKTRLKKFMIKQEDEADQWASDYLKKNGFDENQINYFLIRVNLLKGFEKSKNHKKLKKRIKKHSKKELIDKEFISLVSSL
jgi:hypothetical protein